MPPNASPTAKLFRSSKLFAMPPPLASPEADILNLYTRAVTPKATQLYPTRQAIVTPPSSLHRGDWGLKRPLPDKIQKQSTTPAVRVIAADTIEQITEYESAGDHTRTLAKLQELNLAIVTNRTTVTSYVQKSVFDVDEAKDNTGNPAKDDESRSIEGVASDMNNAIHSPVVGGQEVTLADMTEEEFDRYLLEKIDRERDEFVDFLRREINQRYSIIQKQKAREIGADMNQASKKMIPEEEFAAFLDTLHEERGSAIRLFPAILQYFKISPIFHKSDITRFKRANGNESFPDDVTKSDVSLYEMLRLDKGQARGRLSAKIAPYLPLAQRERLNVEEVLDLYKGAKATHDRHPSLGLSYNRSNAFIEMHPEMGPLSQHSPALARVLQPRITFSKSNRFSIVGLAGVVTRGPNRTSLAINDKNTNWTTGQGNVLDIETPGGETMLVNVQTASVDKQGRLDLQLGVPSPPSIAISQGVPFSEFPVQFFSAFANTGYKKYSTTEQLDEFGNPLPYDGDRQTTTTTTSPLRRVNEPLDSGPSSGRKYARGYNPQYSASRVGADQGTREGVGIGEGESAGAGKAVGADVAAALQGRQRRETPEEISIGKERRKKARENLLRSLGGRIV